MLRNPLWKMGLCLSVLGLAVMVAGIVSCGSAPTPFPVQGPGGVGNEAPTLTVTEPDADITVQQGVPFVIEWTDTDRDDNASITFELVNPLTNQVFILVADIEENDTTGQDSHAADTGLIPTGTYNLLGIINDGVNDPVASYALVAGSATERVEVRIVGSGEGPPTSPPTVFVVQPAFDRSVTQDDALGIVIQPTAAAPTDTTPPYDEDSDATVFIILDRDLNPNNDDPFNPDVTEIIVLSQQNVIMDDRASIAFDILIDLDDVPPNPNGEPYFVRATITDGRNSPVHSYAPGTVNVNALASGTVDLFDIGRSVSGARVYGFHPSAQLGTTAKTASDFDADGIDDFVIVAQFGNPLSAGPVGEAYLVYGQDDVRLGGTISANSISETISGVIFQAPPVRTDVIGYVARTDGITDFDFIDDLNDDGRPELLFGLSHVHGAYDSTDFDPEDDDPQDVPPNFCYPDFLVNNFADGGNEREGVADIGFFAGGMAVIVNSQNRDNDGLINEDRLETTAISLELVGQWESPFGLDNFGFNAFGNINVRADNTNVADNQLGNDPEETGRISGGRLLGGFFNHVHQLEQPREDLFGRNVSWISDLTSDGLNEIIVSSPRNERYLTDLRNSDLGVFSPHWNSTGAFGSITVFPGQNYNATNARAIPDETGTCVTPFLDHHLFPPFGNCDPGQARQFVFREDALEIFAEDIDDFLGGGKSAGDFNQDGPDDILCSAPRNDRSSTLLDTGAVYIIYGRTIVGTIQLNRASDPVLRPPMLRVRGVRRNDQIGLRQASGLDVNGDRIDDVFLSSPRTDFGGVTRNTCLGDFNGDGLANSADLSLASFSDCQVRFGPSVFSSDACKAFDYDNDSDIDQEDRCVFCCLSGTCTVESDCVNGTQAGNCCANMVDNGFVGVVFGGRFIDGDRDITQIATSDLPGVVFYGGSANDLAGWDVSSAGDFNQDGFGDLLIAAPGEFRRDTAGRERVGVVYLVFGGTHLNNTEWNLSDPNRGVGSSELPGIVFISPYVKGRPNEAAPTTVGFLGDINNDGFADIAIGNPKADFIDLTFPQGPDAPGDDASAGRRSDAGDVYIIYGNNFGPNR